MAYTDFSLDAVQHTFGLTINQQPLFPAAVPEAVPPWLRETLTKSMPLALGSEKARSEFIIAPVLLTVRDLLHQHISIYSGQRLDSDASRGLVGECDFIVTSTPQLPIIQAPIITIVEAKKNDVEGGYGQCAAQLVGAHLINQREQTQIDTLYGCVTTGEVWQFLRFQHPRLTLDSERYYINQLEQVLGVFLHILQPYVETSADTLG